LRFLSRSPAETRALARRLAAALGPPGLVVALAGPLGAGKTVFVRGLAEGLGIDPGTVRSPSFVIAVEHEGAGRRLVHVDLYRIAWEEELEEAGAREWLAAGALVAVEWADRFPGLLPADRLEVTLARPAQPGGPGEQEDLRELELVATGPAARLTLARALGAGESSRPEVR
jgi:tRNA threonylcarbamoyladenosine biosynthesis protein TsaE